MGGKKQTPNDQVEELLSKLLTIGLWTSGASQNTIARAVGKSATWVNQFLKGVPKPK
jgi:hypothetical protein